MSRQSVFENAWQAQWIEKTISENPRQPGEGPMAYARRIAQLSAMMDVDEEEVDAEERRAIQEADRR